ncbi:MAG: SPOR domain-containing protein [Halioglobus sp.]|nr:SPOR domain-containing protein [Halioglobus sp.]
MKEGHNDNHRPGHQPLPGFDRTGPVSSDEREPVGEGFPEDAEDIYEDPDRDTNHTSGFREEHVEDEDFDEMLPDDHEESDDELFNEQDEFLRSAVDATLGAASTGAETGRERGANDSRDEPHAGADPEERDVWDEEEYDDDDEWLADDTYPDDDDSSRRWPLGLIAVGAVALVLIIAGAWGIIQQRAATAEEIRELRAQLATRATPEDVSSSRAALQRANERNTALTRELRALEVENRRLRQGLAELETQLAEARAAQVQAPAGDGAKPEDEGPAAGKPETSSAAPAPAGETTTPEAPAATTGDWFVNFGTYGQRTMAREWAQRIAPAAGEVIVAESAQGGDTLYRVRIVGLADRSAAEKVARELQADWGLPRLWVGRR